MLELTTLRALHRGLLATLLASCLWVIGLLWLLPANALTQIELFDVSYTDCPPELATGMVAAGSVAEADCYLVVGKAKNTSGKPVLNADVFGRIYDANNNPVFQNRTRVGSIDEVPPGVSDFSVRISVAANQPTPLKLEQFKASGFTGRVRRY
ncbi:MAG: hypothetical protein ACFB4J_19575 [Elainellaceae cyanobacterium]